MTFTGVAIVWFFVSMVYIVAVLAVVAFSIWTIRKARHDLEAMIRAHEQTFTPSENCKLYEFSLNPSPQTPTPKENQ